MVVTDGRKYKMQSEKPKTEQQKTISKLIMDPKLLIFIVPILLAIFIAYSYYFRYLKVVHCFGLDNTSFSSEEYKKNIGENQNLVLNQFDGEFFKPQDLKRFISYNIFLSNNLKAFVKVSYPTYGKFHEVNLIYEDDPGFVVNFGERRELQHNVRVDEIKKQSILAQIPGKGVVVGSNAVLSIEYNSTNSGSACLEAQPNGFIMFHLFLNNFLKLKR